MQAISTASPCDVARPTAVRGQKLSSFKQSVRGTRVQQRKAGKAAYSSAQQG